MAQSDAGCAELLSPRAYQLELLELAKQRNVRSFRGAGSHARRAAPARAC
jgi:hypothetical protein